VLVVGGVITDIIVRPEGPIAVGTDTKSDIRPARGGSGANQAAWLGTFGIRTIFVGRTGALDRDQCEVELRDFGVEPMLAADPDLPTGMLVTLVAPNGERSFLVDRGANQRLARADLPDSVLDRVGLLHISGYALFEPGPRAAVLDFAAKARRLGIQVTVDPASAGFLRTIGADAFIAWTEGMHICFPNADEAEVLTGSADPEAQLAALAARYDLVVLKRGSEGAVAGNGSGERWRARARPTDMVDTIGAGDAFFAGFASSYFRGMPVQTCLEDGVAAGTLACGLFGGRPPRPEGSAR